MRAGFPHSEILGSKLACQLPEAYRRLQRPSSPVVAKASTTCTCSLDPITLSITRRDVSGPQEALGEHRGDKSPMLIMQSLPRRTRLRNRVRFTSSELLKSSRMKLTAKRSRATFGTKFQEFLVEPTGIEPVTSCLQSRRSPS